MSEQPVEFSFFGKDFPSLDWEDVTPNDSTDLSRIPRALYVGTGGDIVAVSSEGNEVTFTAVVGGTILPIQPARIKATNTTASDIIALY